MYVLHTNVLWFCFNAVALAVIMIVILMIAKLLCEVSNEDSTREGVREIRETTPLVRPEKKVSPVTYYGTCGEENIETGNCSNSTSSSNISGNSSCSEDLYDGKVCVICYDELRNCFLVPCGHCATCYACGQRYAFPKKEKRKKTVIIHVLIFQQIIRNHHVKL